jgi:hypothetical protein
LVKKQVVKQKIIPRTKYGLPKASFIFREKTL